MQTRPVATAVALLTLASTLLGCHASRPSASGAPRPANEVVVASFNFTESRLLAEIYAGALEAAGIPVRRELELGPRELVQPALLDGLVDIVPEYLGTALGSLEPASTVDVSDPAALRQELDKALAPWDVDVLDPAPAENQNGFAVTRTTADRLGLHAVSDLARVSRSLTLAGPAECPGRAYCLEGLERVYGVHFGRFLPFETEEQRVSALEQQVVDVAVMFSTDGELASGDFVLLDDDRHLQPAENVVPVVSVRVLARHGSRLAQALDAVSAQLTSNSLVYLNWRVGVAGKDVAAEAQGWLRRRGLVRRPA